MSFEPGSELKITHYVVLHSENLHLDELVKLPLETLKEMEQASIAKENAIYDKIEDVENEWAEQAKETIRARKAQEYLQIHPVNHTSNQWIENEHGRHEISNMVYLLCYHIYEKSGWDHIAKKSVTVAWEVSWYLMFNTIPNPDDSGSGRQIAGQQRKRFTNKDEMEKYIQGRIKAYSHLFVEISPPIPEEHKKRFFVNGVLLPGYTVEAPEHYEPDEGTVDDLLACLDEDFSPDGPEPPPEPQPEEQTPEAVWNKHKRQRPGASQKKTTPAR